MAIITAYPNGAPRIHIALDKDKITHRLTGDSATEARVVLARGRISVGCTDTTPEVLEHLLAEYRKRFPQTDNFVIQEGKA